MPKATSEASRAAMASAVPALSLSTTVRATATPPARGVTFGAGWAGTPGFCITPPAPAAAVIGFATCVATGDGPPAGLAGATAPPTPGRGGRDMRIVSFRKSAGGLATPGTGGGVKPAGLGGMPGTGGAEGVAAAGTPGTGGFGAAGGVRRIVSFFNPDAAGVGAAGAPGGFGKEEAGGFSPTPGGLGNVGAGGFSPTLGGARGGFGKPGAPGMGGLGAPPETKTPGGRGGVGGFGSGSGIEQ
jgi:hypothetical protein